jgi:hypothetical protein
MRSDSDPLNFFFFLVGVSLFSIAVASLVVGLIQGLACRGSQEVCQAHGGTVVRTVGGDWYCVDSTPCRSRSGGVH